MGKNLSTIDINNDQINVQIDYLPKSIQINIACDLIQLNVQNAHYFKIEFDQLTEGVTHFMSNGFQTWTESRWYDINDSIKNLSWFTKPIWSFFNMKSYGDYYGIQYQRNALHSFHFSCLKSNNQYAFIGSLNEKDGHSIFIYDQETNNLNLLKEVSTNQDKICVELYLSTNKNLAKLFDNYFDNQNFLSHSTPVTGWTSWYHYYTKIDEDIIVENLQNFIDKEIPIDIFQIDDGWQEAVGDWSINKKFPGGLQAIVNHAHNHNIKAGLWLAPFICEKKSTIFKTKPEWIRKNKKGQKVKAGYSLDWSGDFYVLEWRLKEVKEYLENCLTIILNTWGFDLLKLDFLYAVCLGLDQTSKGQEMDDAMDWLNQVIGEKDILACGVPLASTFDKVKYCRVSSDVALKWEDDLLANKIRYRERVSTLNALRSTINRCLLNSKVFINDPDVYILRSEENKLTAYQKETLFLINQSLGGVLFTSDNIDHYSDDQWQLYLKQFPVRKKDIIDLNNIEDVGWILLMNRELIYLLAYNLSDSNQSMEIPEGDWFHAEGMIKQTIQLDAFQTKILLKSSLSENQLLYSDGHLFPGMEIEQMHISDNKINFEINIKCRLKVLNYIFEVNKTYESYSVNGHLVHTELWNGKSVIKYKHKI